MTLKTWIVALLGLAAFGALAQGGPNCPPQATQPTAQQMQEASARAKDRGFLWRATKDGRTHHLYGTIHVGTLDWAFPGPKLRAALGDAETMALELDPLDPQIQASLRGSGGAAAPSSRPASASAWCARSSAPACRRKRWRACTR